MQNIKNKNKLESNWIGSYEIVEIHEPVNVSIEKKNKIIRVYMNHFQLLNKTSD